MRVDEFVGALLPLVLPALVSAQPSAFSPPYDAAVRRYVSGERSRAVTDLGDWPEDRLGPEISALVELRREARGCAECPAAQTWRRTRVAAALMLHTDCAARARAEAKSPRFHESAALQLAHLMKDDPARRAFASRWYGAMAGRAQAEERWEDALAWAERGLRDFPDSAEMLLLQGSIEETLGALAEPDALDEVLLDPNTRGTRAYVRYLRAVREHFEKAHGALRAAVAADPNLLEAQVRLGRVASKLGLREEAFSALDAVVSRRRDGPEAFLAFLFRGRLHEEDGRLDDAARSYESALSIDPRCQSARLALSHVRLRQGDAAAAHREVETAMRAAESRPRDDPFWVYPRGPSVGVESQLEALRREVSS